VRRIIVILALSMSITGEKYKSHAHLWWPKLLLADWQKLTANENSVHYFKAHNFSNFCENAGNAGCWRSSVRLADDKTSAIPESLLSYAAIAGGH
jgi:hypothetical protein